MTPKQIEALKLALEALEDLGMKHFENTGEVLYQETFNAFKEALKEHAMQEVQRLGQEIEATERKWVDLTDDEIDRVTDAQWGKNVNKPIYAAHRAYARAVEAASKEKNT